MSTLRRFEARKSADDVTCEDISLFSSGLGVPPQLRASMPVLPQRSLLQERLQTHKSKKKINDGEMKKKSWLNLTNIFTPSNGLKSLKFAIPKRRQRAKGKVDNKKSHSIRYIFDSSVSKRFLRFYPIFYKLFTNLTKLI